MMMRCFLAPAMRRLIAIAVIVPGGFADLRDTTGIARCRGRLAYDRANRECDCRQQEKRAMDHAAALAATTSKGKALTIEMVGLSLAQVRPRHLWGPA